MPYTHAPRPNYLPPALVGLSFPDFRKALTLHMVETSEDLKASQIKTLGATYAATASYSASRGGGGGGGAREVVGSAMQLPGGGQVVWHQKLDQVKQRRPLAGSSSRSRGFGAHFVFDVYGFSRFVCFLWFYSCWRGNYGDI